MTSGRGSGAPVGGGVSSLIKLYAIIDLGNRVISLRHLPPHLPQSTLDTTRTYWHQRFTYPLMLWALFLWFGSKKAFSTVLNQRQASQSSTISISPDMPPTFWLDPPSPRRSYTVRGLAGGLTYISELHHSLPLPDRRMCIRHASPKNRIFYQPIQDFCFHLAWSSLSRTYSQERMLLRVPHSLEE